MLTQMEQHLQAIVTVLSLVNPLICGTMFAQVEAGQTRATRLADATKAALAVLVILVIAALAGARVLQVFGVSLDAFSIAGGGVLTWIGFSMLRGNSPQAQDPSKDGDAQKRSLAPLICLRPARARLPESSRSLLHMRSWRCRSRHSSRSW
jgi:small neutral amino acid transporter SnatA (MarC family)